MKTFSYISSTDSFGNSTIIVRLNDNVVFLNSETDNKRYNLFLKILAESGTESNQISLIEQYIMTPDDPKLKSKIVSSVVSESEDIEIFDGEIFFQGEKIYGKAVSHILELWEQNLPVQNLLNFLEYLFLNPSYTVREQVYEFIQENKLTITPDGLLVGYKSVTEEGLSISSGTAYVNGNKYVGQIPNAVGDIITMPRASVEDNPDSACSVGLHVANEGYARRFQGTHILTVLVNPEDIVSVPRDCNAQKIRVCKYRIVDKSEKESFSAAPNLIEARYVPDNLSVEEIKEGLNVLIARLSRKSHLRPLAREEFWDIYDLCAEPQQKNFRLISNSDNRNAEVYVYKIFQLLRLLGKN